MCSTLQKISTHPSPSDFPSPEVLFRIKNFLALPPHPPPLEIPVLNRSKSFTYLLYSNVKSKLPLGREVILLKHSLWKHGFLESAIRSRFMNQKLLSLCFSYISSWWAKNQWTGTWNVQSLWETGGDRPARLHTWIICCFVLTPL